MNAPLLTQEQLLRATEIIQHMRAQIARAFMGQNEVVDQVLAALLAAGHVLIEGVPGLGKTLLVQAMAKSVDAKFSRIQFTPDLMPADVTGHTLYDPASGQFQTRRGPVFSHFVLADEINRAPAKTQSALLEVMQEAQVTIEGNSYALDTPFMVLATQNPIEQEGTYPLPEAQLDRFLLKILIDYPQEAEEKAIVQGVTLGRLGDRLDVQALQTLMTPATLTKLQAATAAIRVDEAVLDYALRLVRATRQTPGIAVGAGTRGVISLVRSARALALMNGRDFITPDDVKQMALPVLRHRIMAAPESAIDGVSVEGLVRGLLDRLPAPRL
ncbi:MAG: AAA family ATPase [Burkholderiaceae bacterium]